MCLHRDSITYQLHNCVYSGMLLIYRIKEVHQEANTSNYDMYMYVYIYMYMHIAVSWRSVANDLKTHQQSEDAFVKKRPYRLRRRIGCRPFLNFLLETRHFSGLEFFTLGGIDYTREGIIRVRTMRWCAFGQQDQSPSTPSPYG